MKKLIFVHVLFVFVACKSVKKNANEVVITSKNEVVTNDYPIVIHKIVSDSRCPVGTNCIWAGELVMELCVIQNNEIKEMVTLTFSPNNTEENKAWFGKFIPINKKLIEYKISPSKTEKELELKDYKIELVLE
jgi:hypothetical protein